ncbi:MAG: hypothetical protein GYA62_10490 [Bacteroidales bacterium]|nr:hypothetical protein [Bacteroidales bacterium]
MFFGFGTTLISGQTEEPKTIYKQAFNEQLQMLNGQKTIDFKRAVFLTENAYHKGQLNYRIFCSEISATGQQLKTLIKQRGLENYKTAGNWAVFSYMTDSLPINNFKPCTYDFDDFMGDNDWTKMFVTKLIKTKSGNCHSLPYYYKILCEEIGAKASLALAPNHVYIKHIDEKGQWTNVELTNGGFPRDQWIIKQMAISVEAIKNEIYMKPLTEKESVALTMFDLVSAYENQYGNDTFVLTVSDTALKYFPKCIPILMLKANCIRDMIELEKKQTNPNGKFINENIALYKSTISEIDNLGYKDMPIELYQDWVNSVEEEKIKRGVSTK